MKSKTYRNLVFIFVLPLSFILVNCSKISSWLDEKSDLNHVRPQTLEDFQAILDDNNTMNTSFPSYGLAGSDNYYLTQVNFDAASNILKNLYVWAKDIYGGVTTYEWFYCYRGIERCNIVLTGIEKMNSKSKNSDAIKGSALFRRAQAYYNLAQSFCLPYSEENKNKPGVIIKLSAEVDEPLIRSSITETYARIISDLETAVNLLPNSSGHQTRPNKAAALALLAKTYLVMENYQEAYTNASKSLNEYDVLMDYNDNVLVNLNATYRFPAYPGNPEILFYATGINNRNVGPQTNAYGYIDSTLYQSYHDYDIRKKAIYFNGGGVKKHFRGTYTGANSIFAGIATNEVYLIKAESAVRINKQSEGLECLNKLLEKRFYTGKFSPIKITDQQQLLTFILNERRKELPFTAQIRWEDLRRLNKDSRFSTTLYRKINDQLHSLPANDKKYVLPIPDNEIQLSGIQQNER